jgi:hypothetical protein
VARPSCEEIIVAASAKKAFDFLVGGRHASSVTGGAVLMAMVARCISLTR